MSQDARVVGVIRELYRYPIKSMRGEELKTVELGWHGLEGDRRYAFIQSDKLSGFPWLSAREIPDLIRFRPYFVTPEEPLDSAVRVVLPDGRDVPLQGEEIDQEIRRHFRGNYQLIKIGRGTFDSMPVSLISVATLESLGQVIDRQLETRRFRPNIVVESLDQQPFAEEEWLGGHLIFGKGEDAPSIRLDRKNRRCMVVGLDPTTATQHPEVLREITRSRDQFTGVYGTTVRVGRLRVGDEIRLVRE